MTARMDDFPLGEVPPFGLPLAHDSLPAAEPRQDSWCFDIHHLRVCYGQQTVIDDASLRIPRNAVTAVMGPSGCGKSTFLCSLNRLTDLELDCKVTGDVRCAPASAPCCERLVPGKQVGMIFQRPNPFPFSIWRNLEFPLREHGISDRAELARRIEAVLQEVGLWDEVKDKLRQPAHSLSGGQQQRLCLARALVLDPSVLLMDEPCSALDPISTQKIERLIKTLAVDRTVVLVTHNIAQARRVADYIALFWHDGCCGRLAEHGPAQTVLTSPSSAFAKFYFAYE